VITRVLNRIEYRKEEVEYVDIVLEMREYLLIVHLIPSSFLCIKHVDRSPLADFFPDDS
jgi:hypothetical protein